MPVRTMKGFTGTRVHLRTVIWLVWLVEGNFRSFMGCFKFRQKTVKQHFIPDSAIHKKNRAIFQKRKQNELNIKVKRKSTECGTR